MLNSTSFWMLRFFSGVAITAISAYELWVYSPTVDSSASWTLAHLKSNDTAWFISLVSGVVLAILSWLEGVRARQSRIDHGAAI